MDALETLGRTLGLSFAAGVNLYATIAILGLAHRFGWVALPPEMAIFDHDAVIAVALALYAIEFVADKVPWVDSLWDALHTVIRPIGGAVIAVAALGPASPGMQGMAALLGWSIAAGSHLGKAGTRAIANTSPEPFSNWILSLSEDTLVFTLAWVTLTHPLIALGITVLLLLVIIVAARALWRAIRRRQPRTA
ncbi:MAG TPA: DUF4126 domain-containing protein [Candidatus Binatia bacterium]|nr:DUF4126 domain-containing protein [Candidatus Binatia bacterium]